MLHFGMLTIRKNLFMVESNHKSATLSRSPRQKVGWQNDGLGTTKLFKRPKIGKSFFQSWIFAIFCCWDFVHFSKIKNEPFSTPIYHQKRLDIGKKSYTMTTGPEKWRKCTSQIFKLHHTLFSLTGRAFFKMSKCVK